MKICFYCIRFYSGDLGYCRQDGFRLVGYDRLESTTCELVRPRKTKELTRLAIDHIPDSVSELIALYAFLILPRAEAQAGSCKENN